MFYLLVICRNLRLYPNGNKLGNGSGHISVYVELANLKSLPPGSKILAEFTIQILDQINGKHHSTKGKHWLYQLRGFVFLFHQVYYIYTSQFNLFSLYLF